MIKKITIKNKTNGLSITLLSGGEYRKTYGSTKPSDRYGIWNTSYTLPLMNYAGFNTLPDTVNSTSEAIRRDGLIWNKTKLSKRILSLMFEISSIYNFNHLNAVMYSNEELLRLEIETINDNKFYIDGYRVGEYEGGTVSFECPNIWFNDVNITVKEFTLKLVQDNFFDFKVNDVYFGSGSKYVLKQNSYTKGGLVGEITGVWDGLIITNKLSGTSLTINTRCEELCVIDTVNRTIVIDGEKYTDFTGIFPDMYAGLNEFELKFIGNTTDIQLRTERRISYGNIF